MTSEIWGEVWASTTSCLGILDGMVLFILIEAGTSMVIAELVSSDPGGRFAPVQHGMEEFLR